MDANSSLCLPPRLCESPFKLLVRILVRIPSPVYGERLGRGQTVFAQCYF
jgi:hypothetical protein